MADAGPSTAHVRDAHDDADDDRPKEYVPNPKVAVVVAGAALAVTFGLTLLVLPHVRAAAKMQAPPPQFLSHAHRARPLRGIKPAGAGTTSDVTTGEPVSAAGTGEPVAPSVSAEVARARAFNDREEARLWGPETVDEHGEPVEPPSPWLGFQALGIATAIVGLSAGLGVFGAAKFLGVNSMEEFAAKMRGSLEDSMPEFVAQVRRETDEPAPESPSLLDRYGEVDEVKLGEWVRSFDEDAEAVPKNAAQPITPGAESTLRRPIVVEGRRLVWPK